MKTRLRPRFIAIAGGSGAGKSWLADRLQGLLGPGAGLLSLDDFYRDRSRLSPRQRERINFDHPRAVDWDYLDRVLRRCRAGRRIRVPRYDFRTHSRCGALQSWQPTPIILVEGLWLLGRRSVRRLFDLRIYLACPARIRWRRRLARDVAQRGRTIASVRRQFFTRVEPMHRRHVASQRRWADVVLNHPFQPAEIGQLADRLQRLLGPVSLSRVRRPETIRARLLGRIKNL